MEQRKTLVTEEGLRKLQDELAHLKTVRRREVAEEIQRAKEQGDLSENAEYVDAKEEQGMVEQRIADLETMLKTVEVIRPGAATDGTVVAGHSVTIQWNGQEKTYTIVGAREANPGAGRISNESPLGTALLGKRVGEFVVIRTPSGEREARIVTVA